MSEAEFLKALAKTRKKFRWVNINGLIRTSEDETHCPITAVCAVEKGVTYDVTDVGDASRLLHIRESVMNKIIDAADGDCDIDNEIRQAMLKAVALKESA